MKPNARTLLWLVTILAGSILAFRASAATSADDQAQELFGRGVEMARQNRWIEARASFEKAFSLSPRPVVLINLAGAQARTGLLVEAARNYHRILEDSASAETAQFRKAAAKVLPDLEARIPRIRVRSSDFTPDDSLEIDGVRAFQGGIEEWQPLDPGDHLLIVRRAELERARVAFTLAEREAHDLSLPVALPPVVVAAPAPAALPAPVAAPVLVAATPLQPEPPSRSWWKSPWIWTVAAVVVATATVVTIKSLDSGNQAYSGNIPPGIVSVK